MTIESTSAASTASQVSSIGLQDFLKILTSQLSNQDPLKPLDNQEFIAQVAQFSALEQSRQLNQKIDQLLAVQSATQSVGMLGKTVDVSSSSGTVSGQVTALKFSGGEPFLSVLTTAGALLEGVSLSQVLSVR
ncbi:MAG TPA: flagellar hook capping FlgD N-terminal domain-containing protein [Noviherbaspirillum sp.]|nr:flagellar hook capping FlgD N-terminal domain-containing protein [Noviherbaspirillum sp.]